MANKRHPHSKLRIENGEWRTTQKQKPTLNSQLSTLNSQFSTLLLLAVLVFSGCTHNFHYPDSKIWAHGATGVWLGRQAEEKFDGMEIDLNYSAYQDAIFLGHELCDTLKGLTLGAWFDSLRHPETNYYWLDMKNLTTENAERISHHICQEVRKWGIRDQLMVESMNHQALKTLKDSGLHVILWVDNIYWSGRSEEEWEELTRQQISELHPDALSGDYHTFPLLPNTFPNHNIHIWDTPRQYNDTNVAHTRTIAAHSAVKVVLVDYPEPI